MLNQIIFLFITALELSFSHQCELHNQDSGWHLNNLPLPGPFPCSGNVPGVTTPPGPLAIPAGPVGPISFGLGPLNLVPAILNTASAALARSSPLPSSNISPINLAELVASGAGLQIPARSAFQLAQPCVRHALVPVPVQVVEECITNVPVIRKTIRHQTETFTRHVPVHEKAVSQQFEQIVRHVPVAHKSIRNVIETRVRHVPVIKSRSRTVIEPYTLHVPITEHCTRPVEDSITRNVPHIETRIRPVITRRMRLIPVVERRCRPVVETAIQNVPVKRKIVRLVFERRVRPVVGPCQTCCPHIGIPGHSTEQDLQPESVSQMSNTDNHEYQEGASDIATHQNYQRLLANSDNEGVTSSNCGTVQRGENAISNSNHGYCPCVTQIC